MKLKKNLAEIKKVYFCSGEMAEWSIAAVLKTVDLHGSGGSNPSLSAAKKYKRQLIRLPFLFSYLTTAKFTDSFTNAPAGNPLTCWQLTIFIILDTVLIRACLSK